MSGVVMRSFRLPLGIGVAVGALVLMHGLGSSHSAATVEDAHAMVGATADPEDAGHPHALAVLAQLCAFGIAVAAPTVRRMSRLVGQRPGLLLLGGVGSSVGTVSVRARAGPSRLHDLGVLLR